jgi:phosphoribosylformimino-5-aminoimidazole carboxamide ribotide isomerase
MLIIPAIHIHQGLGLHRPDGGAAPRDRSPFDPIGLIRLFRGENAKTIHLVDLDGAAEGTGHAAAVIRDICSCVEIAVQVAGGFRTYEAVEQILSTLGVYRVVVGTIAVEDPDLVARLIADFSPRKIVVGIDAVAGSVRTRGREKATALRPVELARRMKERGVERILYADPERERRGGGPPIEDLLRIAGETGLSLTLNGGVRDRADLALLEAARVPKLDSIILHEPLYRNAFPCQEIWRANERAMAEAGLDDGFPRMQQRASLEG